MEWNCRIEGSGDEKRAVLTYSRDWLLYDIKNRAYVTGGVIGEGDHAHNRHMVQDVGEEGNVDIVTRELNLAIARCREFLNPYTHREIDRPVIDNKMREPTIYGIVLDISPDFSQTTLNLLAGLIHEYIVSYALAEWLSITDEAKAALWRDKYERLELEIRVCMMTSRKGKIRRRRMHPF